MTADPLTSVLRVLAGPPGRVLARLGVSPNAVTLGALALNLACAVAIAAGALGPRAIGAAILAIGFLDAVDGTVARAGGRVTTFGGVLDAVGDRLSESALLVGLTVAALARNDTAAVAWTAAALGTFPLVSYVRAKAETHGHAVTSGLANRSLRVLLLGASFFVDLYTPVTAFLATASLVTAVHRLVVLRRLLGEPPRRK